jgi:hypothetical protein
MRPIWQCPLSSRKQTFIGAIRMSVLGQNRTFDVYSITSSRVATVGGPRACDIRRASPAKPYAKFDNPETDEKSQRAYGAERGSQSI